MTWVIVLVKEIDAAKQRLAPALAPEERRRLALANAERAVRAALAAGPTLVVAGGEEAAAVARRLGAEVVVEAAPGGQNQAARTGIEAVRARGAGAALLLSSDLPLVTAEALETVIGAAAPGGPAAVAAAAAGRGGTNALYLRPPDVIGLHFGDDSLARFEHDARERGVPLTVLSLPELALDLDEPGDLQALERLRSRAG